ncbi:TIGR03618 family F420-dependent PPOX class oxidoreductase [Herbidospora cretacea]|uniref:TIGR03618 family F420-dependent PPOX class oxidoreductase n=1 Tax=Herbidospora cretacea TaxID=28444 RepID=UPI0004C36E49|nr:TIGR03618 family F420-dependent PPOX class oxidoreductase [Herbidospora cretacea]
MTKNWADVRRYFLRGTVAHVATLLPDGAPHSVPVWVGVEGDQIAFFSLEGSQKVKNLEADPRIALSVTGSDNPLDMATVRGRVVRRVDGDAALPIVDRIAERYTGEPYDIREGLVAFLIQPEVCWARDYTAE